MVGNPEGGLEKKEFQAASWKAIFPAITKRPDFNGITNTSVGTVAAQRTNLELSWNVVPYPPA